MNSKLSAKEPDWFRRRYIALLIEKGLATATGRVHQKRLLDNFVFFYGREMLEVLDSMVDYEEEHNWVFGIARKHRKSFHPVRHLLMMRFLAGSIEQFFNIDTVNRYALRLKLNTSWQFSNDNELVQSQEQPEDDVNSAAEIETRHRQKWLTLQLEHPEASKTTLRQMAPATYAWLYKNDTEWLNQNSPTLRVPVSANNRVDWQQRDRQVLAQVQDVVPLLLNAEKPIRLTIGRIGKTLDLQALLEQHLAQMPLTKAYLESATESIEDYQIRRIKWASAKLEEQGEEVKAWKVIRIAGLREDYSQKVKAALEDELYRQSTAIASLKYILASA